MKRSDSYPDDALIAVAQAADILGVHPDTIRRWADDGHMPVLRTPTGMRRFRAGDIRAVLVPEPHDEPEDPEAAVCAS